MFRRDLSLFFYFVQLDFKWPSFRNDVKDVQECPPTTCASSHKNSWQFHHVMFIISFSEFFEKYVVCSLRTAFFLIDWADSPLLTIFQVPLIKNSSTFSQMPSLKMWRFNRKLESFFLRRHSYLIVFNVWRFSLMFSFQFPNFFFSL